MSSLKFVVLLAFLLTSSFAFAADITPEPLSSFKDCDNCPVMVVIPAGSFLMGSPDNEIQRAEIEGPQHKVNIENSFAIGKYELRFDEWDVCVSEGACEDVLSDHGWGRGSRPALKVSWLRAKAYVNWLSEVTGKTYRLPSESEWEYAARAGSTKAFSTGDTITGDQANINGQYTYNGSTKSKNRKKTIEVGSLTPNDFGLHDMHGNLVEWVEDCRNDGYVGAPIDGSAWLEGDCTVRGLRGGHWGSRPGFSRSATRKFQWDHYQRATIGIRVARDL